MRGTVMSVWKLLLPFGQRGPAYDDLTTWRVCRFAVSLTYLTEDQHVNDDDEVEDDYRDDEASGRVWKLVKRGVRLRGWVCRGRGRGEGRWQWW